MSRQISKLRTENERTFSDKSILPGGAGNTVQVAIGVVVGLIKADRSLWHGHGRGGHGVGRDSGGKESGDSEELHVANEVVK